jgi:hypothetical protein
VFPPLVAVGSVAWAVFRPRYECFSAGDTSGCSDLINVKLLVGAVGIALALLLTLVLALVRRHAS